MLRDLDTVYIATCSGKVVYGLLERSVSRLPDPWGGFLQVARDQVLILADTAERSDEVDEARAEEARRRAREAIAQASTSGQRLQAEAAHSALRRAEARITVAQRRRGPGPHRPPPGPSATG